MPWAVAFAESRGVDLVQFHPFAAVGRGTVLGQELGLDAMDRKRMYVVAKLLESESGPAIQCDIAPAENVFRQSNAYQIVSQRPDETVERLSDLINLIVINETGTVLPFSYGLESRHKIVELSDGEEQSISNSISLYKSQGWRNAQSLVRRALDTVQKSNCDFIDWFQLIVETGETSQS